MSASIMHSEEIVDQGWLFFTKKYNTSDYRKYFCYDVQFIHFCLRHLQWIIRKKKSINKTILQCVIEPTQFDVLWYPDTAKDTGAINLFTSSEKIKSQVSSLFHLADLIISWFLAFFSPLADSSLPPNVCSQQQRHRRLGPSLQPGQGLATLFSLCNLS